MMLNQIAELWPVVAGAICVLGVIIIAARITRKGCHQPAASEQSAEPPADQRVE